MATASSLSELQQQIRDRYDGLSTVSYTHLTLPTT